MAAAQQHTVDALLLAYPGSRMVAARGSAGAPFTLQLSYEVEGSFVSETFTVEVDGECHTISALVPRGRDEEESAVALTNMVAQLLVPEVPVEERAETLRSFIMDVATARVGDEDAEDPYESLGSKVIWEAAGLLEALIDATARAKMLLMMDAAENGDRNLFESMVEAMPTEEQLASSGRAKSTAIWLTEAVPLMRQAGIPPEEIAAVNETNPTILSVGAAPVQRIANDPDLKPKEKQKLYRELLKDMRTKPSRAVSTKWTDHRVGPVRIQQIVQSATQYAVVAIEEGPQQAAAFYNRLSGWYEVVEEQFIWPLTLSDLLHMPYEKLVRTAAFGGPGGRVRRELYDYIKRTGPCGVAVLNGVPDNVTPNEVAIALHELAESGFLTESTKEGGLVWEAT
jgi:hypothetical protein